MGRLWVDRLSLEVPGRQLLSDASFAVDSGECVAVVGPSGVGKTSLLNCAAGIETPTSGSVSVDGVEISRLSTKQRSAFRLAHIGIVFQFGELLPELTLLENVALPLRLRGVSRRVAEEKAAGWLERVDLSRRAHERPELLSGGEIQRGAIARALVHEPSLLLADEPTGMLDEENTERVVRLLVTTSRRLGSALLLVTHDLSVASAADRSLSFHFGRLSQAATTPDPTGRPRS